MNSTLKSMKYTPRLEDTIDESFKEESPSNIKEPRSQNRVDENGYREIKNLTGLETMRSKVQTNSRSSSVSLLED